MLSIIISSYKPSDFNCLLENVDVTIGVEYEIIKVDNPGLMGICEAYNKGAVLAKYHYLCFMHEDLIFHTKDWGKKLISHLNDKSIGLVGVAGGLYKSKSVEAWGIAPIEFARMNVLQGYKSGQPTQHIFSNPHLEKKADVVTLDGLWLSTRRDVWEANKFDEDLFKGFHFYDIDFSLKIAQSYRVCVVYDILIEHKSEGHIDKSWVFNAMIFHKKWKSILPYYIGDIKKAKQREIENDRAASFLFKLKYFNFSRKIYLQYCYAYLRQNSISTNFKILKKQLKKYDSLKKLVNFSL